MTLKARARLGLKNFGPQPSSVGRLALDPAPEPTDRRGAKRIDKSKSPDPFFIRRALKNNGSGFAEVKVQDWKVGSGFDGRESRSNQFDERTVVIVVVVVVVKAVAVVVGVAVVVEFYKRGLRVHFENPQHHHKLELKGFNLLNHDLTNVRLRLDYPQDSE